MKNALSLLSFEHSSRKGTEELQEISSHGQRYSQKSETKSIDVFEGDLLR